MVLKSGKMETAVFKVKGITYVACFSDTTTYIIYQEYCGFNNHFIDISFNEGEDVITTCIQSGDDRKY